MRQASFPSSISIMSSSSSSSGCSEANISALNRIFEAEWRSGDRPMPHKDYDEHLRLLAEAFQRADRWKNENYTDAEIKEQVDTHLAFEAPPAIYAGYVPKQTDVTSNNSRAVDKTWQQDATASSFAISTDSGVTYRIDPEVARRIQPKWFVDIPSPGGERLKQRFEQEAAAGTLSYTIVNQANQSSARTTDTSSSLLTTVVQPPTAPAVASSLPRAPPATSQSSTSFATADEQQLPPLEAEIKVKPEPNDSTNTFHSAAANSTNSIHTHVVASSSAAAAKSHPNNKGSSNTPHAPSVKSEHATHSDRLEYRCSRDIFEFETAVRFPRDEQDKSIFYNNNGRPRMIVEPLLPSHPATPITDTQVLIWLGRARDKRVDTVEDDMWHHYESLCKLQFHPSSELKATLPHKLVSMARVGGPATKNAIALLLDQPLTKFKFDHKLMLYTLANFEIFSLREWVGNLDDYRAAVKSVDGNKVDPAPWIPCMFLYSNYRSCKLTNCSFSHDNNQVERLRNIRRMYVEQWRGGVKTENNNNSSTNNISTTATNGNNSSSFDTSAANTYSSLVSNNSILSSSALHSIVAPSPASMPPPQYCNAVFPDQPRCLNPAMPGASSCGACNERLMGYHSAPSSSSSSSAAAAAAPSLVPAPVRRAPPSALDERKYSELLSWCVIAPPASSVLANFYSAHSAPSFSLPAFERLHTKLQQEDFDKYFTVCRRRRIQWIGCPMEVQPDGPNRWRVPDANNIWKRLVYLMPNCSAAAAAALHELVFINRSPESQHIILHFKSESAARVIVAEVCEKNARMGGLFQCLGRPAPPGETPLAPLPLALVPIASTARALASAASARAHATSELEAATQNMQQEQFQRARAEADNRAAAALATTQTEQAAASSSEPPNLTYTLSTSSGFSGGVYLDRTGTLHSTHHPPSSSSAPAGPVPSSGGRGQTFDRNGQPLAQQDQYQHSASSNYSSSSSASLSTRPLSPMSHHPDSSHTSSSSSSSGPSRSNRPVINLKRNRSRSHSPSRDSNRSHEREQSREHESHASRQAKRMNTSDSAAASSLSSLPSLYKGMIFPAGSLSFNDGNLGDVDFNLFLSCPVIEVSGLAVFGAQNTTDGIMRDLNYCVDHFHLLGGIKIREVTWIARTKDRATQGGPLRLYMGVKDERTVEAVLEDKNRPEHPRPDIKMKKFEINQNNNNHASSSSSSSSAYYPPAANYSSHHSSSSSSSPYPNAQSFLSRTMHHTR